MIGRGDLFEAIEYLRREGEGILARFARSKRGVVYADLRLEVVFNRSGAAVNGEPRDGSESESAAYAVSVHVADRAGPVGHGQTGAEIGALAARPAKLVARTAARSERSLRSRAFQRAQKSRAHRASRRRGERSAASRRFHRAKRFAMTSTRVFSRDPRTLSTDELKKISLDASHQVAALGDAIAFRWWPR